MKEEVFKENEKFILRSENLAEMEKKAEKLESISKDLKNREIKVRKAEKLKKYISIIGIIIALIIIGYLLTCIVCNSFTFDC